MSCPTCKCTKAPCGCEDQALTTGSPCVAPTCPNPEPCAETWSDCCVIHNGDSYTYIPKGLTEAPTFDILQGERMCDTWQRFLAYYECSPTAVPAPYGLKSKSITSTTINVAWTPVSAATSYEVWYSLTGTISWVSAGTVNQNTTPNFTITGLTPNTTYYVHVVATDGVEESCRSVSLILTTKQA